MDIWYSTKFSAFPDHLHVLNCLNERDYHAVSIVSMILKNSFIVSVTFSVPLQIRCRYSNTAFQ